jgi:outer membrane protein TolC
LKAVRENLRFAEERYRLGAGILLDQITASVQLREAEADYVSTLYDYLLARMRLKNAMGTLEKERG